MKGKKDGIKPLILRLGVAFVLTFSGYLYSQFRSRRIRPNPSQSPGMNLFPLFLFLGFGFFFIDGFYDMGWWIQVGNMVLMEDQSSKMKKA